MENFQKWKDVQMGANRIEKLEEGFEKSNQKLKGKVKKKSKRD